MPIKVTIPTPMREMAGGQTVVATSGGTVQAVLDDLTRQFPTLSAKLFKNGQLQQYINLFLNGEDVRYLDEMATPVKDGDELSIIPAVAGG